VLPRPTAVHGRGGPRECEEYRSVLAALLRVLVGDRLPLPRSDPAIMHRLARHEAAFIDEGELELARLLTFSSPGSWRHAVIRTRWDRRSLFKPGRPQWCSARMPSGSETPCKLPKTCQADDGEPCHQLSAADVAPTGSNKRDMAWRTRLRDARFSGR